MKKQIYINKSLPILWYRYIYIYIYIYPKGGHRITMEWGDGAVEEGRGAADSKSWKPPILHAKLYFVVMNKPREIFQKRNYLRKLRHILTLLKSRCIL